MMSKKSDTESSGFDFPGWDRRVSRDLGKRLSTYDKRWDTGRAIIGNKSPRAMQGNLVREYAQILFSRIVVKHPTAVIESDDNRYAEEAHVNSVIANSLIRMLDLKDALRDATVKATYAAGFLYIGHPAARFGVDPKYHPGVEHNTVDLETFHMESQWEPVDQLPPGVDSEAVDIFDPKTMEELRSLEAGEDKSSPLPVFNEIGEGMPYIESVDPRHVVVPTGLTKWEDAEYFARIRCVTGDELRHIAGVEIKHPRMFQMSTQRRKLFPDIDFEYNDECYVLIECHVVRDRKNGQYNNWYACWILDHPDIIIRDMPNPWGGMRVLTPVIAQKIGDFYDNSMIDDLYWAAQLYSLILQSIERDVHKTLNTKVLMDRRAGTIDNKEKARITNPNFSGIIDVESVDGVKEMGVTVDYGKLQLAQYVRKLGQNSTSTSDLDAAQPIKKITARQTEQLVQASNEVIEALRSMVAEAAAAVIKKLMFVLRMFHGERREFKFGNRIATWDPAKQDATMSLVYKVDVKDLGPDPGENERLLFAQFLRVLSSFEELKVRYDMTTLAKEGARLWNLDADAVLSEMPAVQPKMPQEIPGLEMIPGTGQPGLESQRPYGGHGPGDQGLVMDAANSASGLRRTV